jgi:DNA-binding HxlR family transcriptional regulator
MSKAAKTTAPGAPRRSPCPISGTLDILGDKWTLLVIRDLFLGKRLFGEFLESPEGIPTNILAERLKRLETNGLIRREAYQQRPLRHAYALTRKGADLLPVLTEIMRWANAHVPGTLEPPDEVLARARAVRRKASRESD